MISRTCTREKERSGYIHEGFRQGGMAWLWLHDRKPESERESLRGRSVCCNLQISVTQARLANYDADWSVVVIVPTSELGKVRFWRGWSGS